MFSTSNSPIRLFLAASLALTLWYAVVRGSQYDESVITSATILLLVLVGVVALLAYRSGAGRRGDPAIGDLSVENSRLRARLLRRELAIAGFETFTREERDLLGEIVEALREAEANGVSIGTAFRGIRELHLNDLPTQALLQCLHDTLVRQFHKTCPAPANEVGIIIALWKVNERDGKKYLERCGGNEMSGDKTPVLDTLRRRRPLDEAHATPETVLYHRDDPDWVSDVPRDSKAMGEIGLYADWPDSKLGFEAIQAAYVRKIFDPSTNEVSAIMSVYSNQNDLFHPDKGYLSEIVEPNAAAYGLRLQRECLRLQIHSLIDNAFRQSHNSPDGPTSGSNERE